MFEELTIQARKAVQELIEAAKLGEGMLVVVGCSSSEAAGKRIGTESSPQAAQAIFEGIFPELERMGIFLAAQCCEHLNRALIVEQEAVHRFGLERVNVVPQPKAGGSFTTAAWQGMYMPAAVEEVRADAGMDIGGTLIGMHLKRVAVPLRLSLDHIGEATLICARTRFKFVGGERAHYDQTLL